MDEFELAAGSVIGRRHRQSGRNNQDAYYWRRDEAALVAVVCDGCSSSPFSEVGAHIGARLVATTIHQYVQHQGAGSLQQSHNWATIQHELLQALATIATYLSPDRIQVIHDCLLFTVVAAVITPDQTWIAAMGDGEIALNGDWITLPIAQPNQPPYLAYGLIADHPIDIAPTELNLTVRCQVPTPTVQTLVIGTDGVQDLRQACDRTLPGKTDLVGPVDQFWTADAYFRNPDQLRRRLTLINRDSPSRLDSGPVSSSTTGLLPDDTTLIVVRRRAAGGDPC